MKKAGVLFIMLVSVFIFTTTAKAALYDRGGGLIYDDVLDITWMQNAYYMGNTMTWDNSITWVDSLVFQGYNDWRMPTTDTSCSGNNCTGSEMGHLFYISGITSSSQGLFTNIKPSIYWSSTEYDSSQAWRFNFFYSYGTQSYGDKTQKRNTWAVRNGDSAPPVVPEPISSVLFVAGAATLGFRKLRR